MATSIAAFNIGLYEEHLDEASFLYDVRRSIAQDAKRSWQDAAPFEDRLEAHLDALTIGGAAALAVCLQRATDGDAGEVYAAARVVCRAAERQPFADLMRSLDSAAKREAIALALRQDLPATWQAFVIDSLERRASPLLAAVVEVAGCLRLRGATQIASGLIAGALPVRPALEALGRLGEAKSLPAIAPYLDDDDPHTAAAACQAALRSGLSEALQRCRALAETAGPARIALALAGGRSCVDLLARGELDGGTPAGMLALGMLGAVTALPRLARGLGEPSLAESAALALHWLTGAALYDEVAVADDDEEGEGEGDGDQLAGWRRRRWPQRGGSVVRRLSIEPSRWSAWWAEHGSRFSPDVRYRLGHACSPARLIDHLADRHSDPALRRLTAQELTVRYRCEVPFEVDLSVREQQRAIQAMREWEAVHRVRFEPGLWYYAGGVVSD